MTSSLSSTTTPWSSQLLRRAALELGDLRECQSCNKDDDHVMRRNRNRLSSSSSSLSSSSSSSSSSLSSSSSVSVQFPPECLKLLLSIEGNRYCVDCSNPNPEWASVTYGTLLCMRCCGRHRSYGVNTSFTRSLDMDSWSYQQVLAMLEGGNYQIQQFFERHQLGSTMLNSDSESNYQHRYHTKAARFYKVNLAKHTQYVSEKGTYQGREANRPPSVRDASDSSSVNESQTITSARNETCMSSSSNTIDPIGYSNDDMNCTIHDRHRKSPSETSSSPSSVCYVVA